MVVVNTSVNNSNLDTLSTITGSMDLVDTCRLMNAVVRSIANFSQLLHFDSRKLDVACWPGLLNFSYLIQGIQVVFARLDAETLEDVRVVGLEDFDIFMGIKLLGQRFNISPLKCH